MEPIRTRSFKQSFRWGWVTARGSRSNQQPAAVRLHQLPPRTPKVRAEPSVGDFLDVNAEVTYTTVVEGLEEFLYQRELQICV